jgi:hypothetical protein
VALTRVLRIACAGCAVLVLASLFPLAAGADELSVSRAKERAAKYAESTCAHDKSCARASVKSCRRQSRHVVLCRVFDHRKTEAQGRFVCTRLIRLSLDPRTHRVPVTGVSSWDC